MMIIEQIDKIIAKTPAADPDWTQAVLVLTSETAKPSAHCFKQVDVTLSNW